MTQYRCDLAISAVASDAGFVGEFMKDISAQMRMAPEWESGALSAERASPALLGRRSRVAVVLHQQLWQHDAATQDDAEVLRERVGERPGSVCVITLDDCPLPSLLAGLPRYDLAVNGRTRAVEFVIEFVAAAGGSVKRPTPAGDHEVPVGWPYPPTPFMAQPRAFGALRHELDTLVDALKSTVTQSRTAQPENTFELQVHPYRIIARLEDVAISFSWVGGRGSTVADGRLMVIAWSGVEHAARGAAALKSAKPTRERVYQAEGGSPDEWRWRSDDLTGQPYSSSNLVGQWIARAEIARAAVGGS